MKRRVSAAQLVLTLIGMLSVAGPVSAAQQVPFNGRLRGDVSISPLDPPFAFVLIEAAGARPNWGGSRSQSHTS